MEKYDISKFPEIPFHISMNNLISILSELDDGIIISDHNGVIKFFNKALCSIEKRDPSALIGRKLTEVYDVTEENSPTLQCIRQQRPILRFTQFYVTNHGRAIFALQNVFPLFEDNRFAGAINFIREYSSIEREMDVASSGHRPRPKNSATKNTFKKIIGSAPEFLQMIHTAKMASASPSPIMIFGESGTGKEMFAKSIHNYSQWGSHPFIAINCSAIPETLLEGILFGTAKGAFTDAKDKPGLFEDANDGTLFLDELNSMSIGLQAKLLRAIQEKKIRRVGSSKEININLKLISSVNKEPEQAIQDNELRRDLYYRLAVVFISIPPLRNRKKDIPVLVDHFIRECNDKLKRDIQTITSEVLNVFLSYDWPGNVRELEHVIEGAMNLVVHKTMIDTNDLPVNFLTAFRKQNSSDQHSGSFHNNQTTIEPVSMSLPDPLETGVTLFQLQNQYEKGIICQLLEKYRGNANKAAQQIGISRQLIYHKIKKHGIRRDDFK